MLHVIFWIHFCHLILLTFIHAVTHRCESFVRLTSSVLCLLVLSSYTFTTNLFVVTFVCFFLHTTKIVRVK
jgi:hypothetical protein